LNMLALTALSKRFLKPMIQRGRGHIVNLASLAADQPGGPGFAVYYATKSYVLSFSKTLALELRGSGIHVSAVCPGPVATAFKDRSGAADSWLYRLPKNTPEKIAGSVCRAIKSHRSVVLPGIFSKFLAFAGEMPPRRIALEVNNLLLRSSR
ncbi:MAG: SDR family NAD(P)-dependent oxidoreductase, partial [Candidatus Thiodiazotropha sp.]